MRYQVQFHDNTLTLPSLIWLQEFLVKRKGVQNAHQIASMIQSGKVYQDKEIKIIMLKGE